MARHLIPELESCICSLRLKATVDAGVSASSDFPFGTLVKECQAAGNRLPQLSTAHAAWWASAGSPGGLALFASLHLVPEHPGSGWWTATLGTLTQLLRELSTGDVSDSRDSKA